MKQVLFDGGGRPFYDDDLETIQVEAQASVLAILAGLNHDCIVTGCTISGSVGNYTVTPGVVYFSNLGLVRCLGASGVSLPAALVGGDISVLDERTYQTGDTKTCIQEQFAAVLVNSAGGLQLYPGGGLTLAHVLRSQVNELGDVKWGRLVTANYDPAGLGLPGTVGWGWALCNGQHGTDDLRGRFIVGYDSTNTDYAAVGDTGGAASVTLGLANLPAHTHGAGLKITDSKGGGEAAFNAALTASPNAKGNTITTQSAGGGQAFDNRPPYYVLAARQWVGL